jgi:hypothetical protein
MKVFNLRCHQGHAFEGWFASAVDYERQTESGQLRCPVCDSAEILKAPSAPRLNFGALASVAERSDDAQVSSTAAPADRTSQGMALGNLTPELQARLLEAMREIANNTEDVGERFAEEARKIHYREAPARGIRGIASDREREELHDEGIDIVRLPWPTILKEPLQ